MGLAGTQEVLGRGAVVLESFNGQRKFYLLQCCLIKMHGMQGIVIHSLAHSLSMFCIHRLNLFRMSV